MLQVCFHVHTQPPPPSHGRQYSFNIALFVSGLSFMCVSALQLQWMFCVLHVDFQMNGFGLLSSHSPFFLSLPLDFAPAKCYYHQFWENSWARLRKTDCSEEDKGLHVWPKVLSPIFVAMLRSDSHSSCRQLSWRHASTCRPSVSAMK